MFPSNKRDNILRLFERYRISDNNSVKSVRNLRDGLIYPLKICYPDRSWFASASRVLNFFSFS